MGDLNANLFSLLFILVVNIGVGLFFETQRKVLGDEFSRIRTAHILWTVNWVLWLFSWFVIMANSFKAAIILNDLGAFSLIAFSITYSSGTAAIRKYVIPLSFVFVVDCIYLLTVDFLVHKNVDPSLETDIHRLSVDQWSSVIHQHTVLFGPSLCVTMLALGLVAWVLASRSKHFETGIVVSLVGAVYALAQIYIYQNGLFVPFLQMSHAATVFLITWRILFLAVYWLIILAAAGIQLAWARILTVVSTAAGLIATINSLIGNIKKH